MFQIFLIIQVLLGLGIIGLVLLQQGKGADMGAAFGSGSSGTVFGSRGGGSFFTRLTGILAALFFANSVLLSSPLVHDRNSSNASITEQIGVATETEETLTEEVPAIDVAPADLPDMPALDNESPEVEQGTTTPDDLPE